MKLIGKISIAILVLGRVLLAAQEEVPVQMYRAAAEAFDSAESLHVKDLPTDALIFTHGRCVNGINSPHGGLITLDIWEPSTDQAKVKVVRIDDDFTKTSYVKFGKDEMRDDADGLSVHYPYETKILRKARAFYVLYNQKRGYATTNTYCWYPIPNIKK